MEIWASNVAGYYLNEIETESEVNITNKIKNRLKCFPKVLIFLFFFYKNLRQLFKVQKNQMKQINNLITNISGLWLECLRIRE